MKTVLPFLNDSFKDVMVYVILKGVVYTDREQFDYLRYKLKTSQIIYEPQVNYGKIVKYLPKRPWNTAALLQWLLDLMVWGQPLSLIEYIFKSLEEKDTAYLADSLLEVGDRTLNKETYEYFMSYNPRIPKVSPFPSSKLQNLDNIFWSLRDPYEGLDYFLRLELSPRDILNIFLTAIKTSEKSPSNQALDNLDSYGYKFVTTHPKIYKKTLKHTRSSYGDIKRLLQRISYPLYIMEGFLRKALLDEDYELADTLREVSPEKIPLRDPISYLFEKYKKDVDEVPRAFKYLIETGLFDPKKDGETFINLFIYQDVLGRNKDILEKVIKFMKGWPLPEGVLKNLRDAYGSWP